MNALDLVNLTPLMKQTSGNPEITVGLIDGPVALDHPELANANIRFLSRNASDVTQLLVGLTESVFRGSPLTTQLVLPMF